MMEVYLDNAATTPVSENVARIVVDTMTREYGNPSSKHLKGVGAEMLVREARERIAATLHASPDEIFFTSGGTESNNWALIGAAQANRRAGNHIITTSVEHAAVLQPLRFLEEAGFSVTYLPVDAHGRICIADLKAAIREDTILVSVMYVNNEIGTVEPVAEAGAAVREWNRSHHREVLFHVDAIQAYGKFRIAPAKLGIDLMSVSGHKIHGPKGSGFLYIRKKAKIRPLILGGGQQQGMRSGTDNVPGAAGLGEAAKEAYEGFDQKVEGMRSCRRRLMEGLKEIEGTYLVTEEDESVSAPHIVSCAFQGVRSEVLLHALEEKGVYVSSGSACSSNRKNPVSSVIQEIHLKKELRESVIRFSFSDRTTTEEIDYALAALRELLPVLRRYSRR
jgi:cysteine desulfurase